MKYHLYLLIIMTSPLLIPAQAEISRWVPHDHPAIIKRQITAFTKPVRFLDLSAEFNGRISKISVNEGDSIPEHAENLCPVITLDNHFSKIARDQAKSDLDSEIIEKQKISTQLALETRETSYLEKEVQRIKGLAESGKVSKKEFDLSIFQADMAKLRAQEKEQDLKLVEQSIIDKKLMLNDAQEQLDRHTLYAPSKWIVTKRHVEVGSIITSGHPLLRLADISEFSVDLILAEDEIRALSDMDPISIHFPHQNMSSVNAYIHHIDVDYDPRTRKRTVELRFAGPQSPIPSGGLEVSIFINIPDDSNTVMIPRSFVHSKLEQSFVTTTIGQQLPIIPLRFQNGFVIVAKNLIPEKAVLILPNLVR